MHHVESIEHLNELFNNSVCVVDFYANWCGPCKKISPFLEQLSVDYEHRGVNVCKINVDGSPDLAETYGIEALPTILIFNNGTLVQKFEGVSPTFHNELLYIINKLV